MNSFIILSNVLNFFGILFLIAGHYLVSKENKNGFIFSAFGALIISFGSYLLQSYPVILLNILWFMISIYAFLNHKVEKNEKLIKRNKKIILNIILALSIFIVFIKYGIDKLAWITTSIYIFSYFLYSRKNITLNYYLALGVIGFVIIIPHLLIKESYSVLMNETVNALISIKALILINKEQRREKNLLKKD